MHARRRYIAFSLAAALAAAPALLPADAAGAVRLNVPQRNAAITAVAAFPSVKGQQIRVRGSAVSMRDVGARLTFRLAQAHRSQIDPDFTRIDLWGRSLLGGERRLVALVERVGKRHKLHYFGPRDGFAKTICRRPAPGVRIIHDLGLGPVEDNRHGVRSCRYDRRIGAITRPMAAGEITGLRALYEPQDYTIEYPNGDIESGRRSAATPAFTEATTECRWDAAQPFSWAPHGVVSRSDPRFGVLTIQCVTATEGYSNGAVADETHLLVARAGRTGPFTRLIAHVIRGDATRAGTACGNDRRAWGLPARPRVELGFCTPFPSTLARVEALDM